MWLLESDGDVFEDKRVWLRPGKTYLFGRTHSRGDGAGKGFKIEHSTISRKHATVTVDLPKAGDVSRLDSRSLLRIEDLGSKHGVVVGTQKLSNNSLSLHGDEHSFRLGGFEQTFRIKWHSVVFTFKTPSKDKDKKLLKEKLALLEPLDIKAIDKFDTRETTHVISNKRNTPQTLQALVHAKYIVDDSILKELEYVTTEGNLDEPESMSKLELDFDNGWPDPLKFLPAVNREPNPKPEEYFKPDASRNKVFRGYSFIMFDKKQYDGIQPAIVGGGGRAKLHELKLGQSTSADIIRCMKEQFEAAESLEEGSGYGVLPVRLVVNDPSFEEWATRIQTEMVTATGQGLVEQNEFLEVILLKDARGMIKKAASQADSLASVESGIRNNSRSTDQHHYSVTQEPSRSQPRTQVQATGRADGHNVSTMLADQEVAVDAQQISLEDQNPSVAPQTTNLNSAMKSRRNRRAAPAASAWKGFADDAMGPADSFSEDTAKQEETKPVTTPEAPTQFMDIDECELVEDEPDLLRTPRKRPLPPDVDSQEDDNAKLYPAQAAAKRRRVEVGETTPQSVSPKPKSGPTGSDKKARKVNAEVDYESRMRNVREEQEKVNDGELEPMHEQLEKMSFGERQRLVKISEFEVKPKERTIGDPQAKDSRWKDEWNERKNFKGFRKKGQPANTRSGPKIIIALEPIRVASATEEYLAAKLTEAEKRRARRKQEQEDESEASQNYTDANTHLEEAPAELVGDGGPEIVDIDAPRFTRSSDKGSEAPDRSKGADQSRKRHASTTPAASIKRNKRLKLPNGEDDISTDEDEVPKFRFKRK